MLTVCGATTAPDASSPGAGRPREQKLKSQRLLVKKLPGRSSWGKGVKNKLTKRANL